MLNQSEHSEIADLGSMLRIPVLLRKRGHGIQQAVGIMCAGDLVDRYQIATRDHTKKTGYQRAVSRTRVNKLVADLRRRTVDLPTAVLLNLRHVNETSTIHTEGRVYFCPAEAQLHVVDGQHRIEALAQLVEEDRERWYEFPLSFVCMLGANEAQEMREFYVVNSTAKSVRTDLALDLLQQQASANPGVMQDLLDKGEDWKVEGQTVTEELAKSRVWKSLVRFPNEPRADTLIGSAGMVSSLKQLLATPYYGKINTENKVKILIAMWEGVSRVLTDAFNSPHSYALQKTTGVMVVHKILISVLEILRANGHSVVDPDSYENVLRDSLEQLESENAQGATVRGADFWRVGAEGAAGAFSNNAGRRVLTARIISKLPEIAVE